MVPDVQPFTRTVPHGNSQHIMVQSVQKKVYKTSRKLVDRVITARLVGFISYVDRKRGTQTRSINRTGNAAAATRARAGLEIQSSVSPHCERTFREAKDFGVVTVWPNRI